MKRSYLARIGTLISQSANTIFLNGNPDESVSARSYREGVLEGKPKWDNYRKVINVLFFFEKDHCHAAYLTDYEHALDIVLGQKKVTDA